MANREPNLDAPLIANAELDNDGDDYLSQDGIANQAFDKRADEQPGLFVWLLTFSAGISGLLFGYDTGVISATLVSIGTSLSSRELTSADKSIITASTALAALLVSPFSSLLADRLGRRRVILLADVLFLAGAALQAASRTVPAMTAGRSVVGAAVGAASFVVPLYIAEVAPARARGRLVTANVLFVTLGQVAAYLVGWALASRGGPAAWRWMVGLGAIPAALQFALVCAMPETPRWLVAAGRVAEARAVVRKVYGGGSGGGIGAPGAHGVADAVVRSIEEEVRGEEEARRLRARGSNRAAWLDGLRELVLVRKHRRALAITCLLQGLQQLCGFNSLMYFSATIFTMLGFKSPTLTSFTVAFTNFIFTIVALLLIDRIGRRRVLLYSVPFMMAGLLLSAYGFASITPGTAADATPGAPADRTSAFVVLVAVMIYVAAYAIGLGNVPWMQSELFPLSVRSLGSGISTGTNWLANFVVGLTFLPLMEALKAWTFVLYAAVCGVGLGLVWKIYPETSGLSLEEATSLLESDGWGVW